MANFRLVAGDDVHRLPPLKAGPAALDGVVAWLSWIQYPKYTLHSNELGQPKDPKGPLLKVEPHSDLVAVPTIVKSTTSTSHRDWKKIGVIPIIPTLEPHDHSVASVSVFKHKQCFSRKTTHQTQMILSSPR